MRFEFFLTILKNAKFMIGNSSAGIREAPHYGVPAINVGSRQLNRVVSNLVINSDITLTAVLEAITLSTQLERRPEHNFGDGRSAERFKNIIAGDEHWQTSVQKQFIDGPQSDRE
jgi:UDP-N-acetylglucosamine 2-epimerase (hydrolysing)